MHLSLPGSRILRILAIALFAASCTDSGAPTALDEFGPQSTVTVTYQAGGGAQLAFLEPLIKGEASGPLATGLTLTITICNITASEEGTDCIDLEAVEEVDHYHANWKDKTAQPNETYRIEVFTSFGLRIGSLELLLDGESGDNDGRTFPIKFWVGEGLGDAIVAVEDCIGDDRCNADFVPSGTGTVVITTQNEVGATMAKLTFPSGSVPEGGLVVTLDCRLGGFLPTQGPLPTALNQWPLFCNITATNPDGSRFLGDLKADATLDICIVDNEIQPAYHAFPDPDSLVLGKSNGPGDFVFLEKVPSSFGEDDCLGNTTTLPVEGGLSGRFLYELDKRLAPAFSVLMPEGLRAAPMWFRDGGVGGLISSFSDINPVEPAYISGTVAHASGGIEDVIVTLSGDASAVDTTDADGSYEFGPLQAAPNGSNYTVTVTPPSGEVIADPVVDTLVTGTGTTTVDFETELPAGIFYYEDTGNYYTSVSTPMSWEAANTNALQLQDFRSCEPQLASVRSAGEDAFITTMMPQVAQAGLLGSSGNGGYWLGGLQPDGSTEPGNGWQWTLEGSFPGVNGEATYANWAGGEPNNSGGGIGEGATNTENRLQYFGDWAGLAAEKIRWNDEPGSRAYGSVVEYRCNIENIPG